MKNKIKRNINTPESKAFWSDVNKNSDEYQKLPAWKKMPISGEEVTVRPYPRGCSETLKIIVEKLHDYGFKYDEIHLEDRESGLVGGYISSYNFSGMSQIKRQNSLRKLLKSVVKPKQLGLILTTTPNEIDDNVDDNDNVDDLELSQTDSKKAFWDRIRKSSAIVDTWPDWKKGGINVEQPGIVKKDAPLNNKQKDTKSSITIENKHSFQDRLVPYFSPSDQLDIKLAYCLAKFGHRAQVRKELIEGKPTRYFEHVRRVSIILMDEMKIMERNMIIAAILHDSLEDCIDLSPELLEHSFGSDVVTMIKSLSKLPKEGYVERLSNCKDWRVLAIKACDRLDNLRSLMVEGTSEEFQIRQIKETKEKYFPIFDNLLKICPSPYIDNISPIRDEIRRLIEKYSTIIELKSKS
jgi:hypothetical protein